tara:strand:+ start:4778 stop:6289 length:1512 start_codon:yes stop_codon:yes gene_type:complete
MNLSSLREAIRTKTGYPERGKTGKDRINRVVNYALRQVRRDAPEALFREELRFRLEKEISAGTLAVDSGDDLVFTVSADDVTLSTDGTLRARWLEIKKSDTYHLRRIRDVFALTVAERDYYKIVIDKPWLNKTDAGLSYRIFTYEYPYPADVEKIRSVIRNPDTNPRELLEVLHPESLAHWRLGVGWRSTGTPDKYARGDYFQLPSPHYTPVAEVPTTVTDSLAFTWGFDVGGNEHGKTDSPPQYGAAGKFSYRVCHVWGRWPHYDINQDGILKPFYISSPSPPTEQVETTWGSHAVKLTSPDVDWMEGYGPNSSLNSYHKAGIEKWWFRARHDTEDESSTSGKNAASVTNLENDDIYYLWRVTDGFDTVIYDRGDYDPVDKQSMLNDFHGHFHLRFDRSSNDDPPMLCRLVRRPVELKHDNDVPRVPVDCFEAIISLSCAYLVGDRDGNPDRKGMYYSDYLRELDRLKRAYTFSGAERGPFGNGLLSRGRIGMADYDVTESS